MKSPLHPKISLVKQEIEPGLWVHQCPESRALLSRYRVGHRLAFQIDRSPLTGGVWLDRGEWDALKSQGLHPELHLVFTAPFQKAIRSQALADQMLARFKERIGETDFEKVEEFRRWMSTHAHAEDIRAFLLELEF